jgi:hypothetical protein
VANGLTEATDSESNIASKSVYRATLVSAGQHFLTLATEADQGLDSIPDANPRHRQLEASLVEPGACTYRGY